MKIVPLRSTSPRLIKRYRIGEVHLEAVFDPKDGLNYLSIGIGEKSVRRTWLTPEQTEQLIGKLKSVLTVLWSK